MIADQLCVHILDKIDYHEKLRLKYEASEEYEQCAIHRDEVLRLRLMLAKTVV